MVFKCLEDPPPLPSSQIPNICFCHGAESRSFTQHLHFSGNLSGGNTRSRDLSKFFLISFTQLRPFLLRQQ
ncbi:unnamed protein product [Pleuronectes platessa]|uniref:Uncharacterized protein n=1 Tax=Pleuronectes platessa TaxID=8262 RepID=A0A9N7W5V3_PLEPL|nr:unnamed protein product [Pleuronectes platessa]